MKVYFVDFEYMGFHLRFSLIINRKKLHFHISWIILNGIKGMRLTFDLIPGKTSTCSIQHPPHRTLLPKYIFIYVCQPFVQSVCT